MSLPISDGLPAIEIRFGTSDNDEVPCSIHLDTCASINTGNLLLHQWLITTHPKIVHRYEQFDNTNPFQPIHLLGAINTDDLTDFDHGKLTAVVTYKTRYTDTHGKPMLLSFGLGKSVAVNALIGLPTLTACKMILDLHENKAHSKEASIWFPITLSKAASGLPNHVNFSENSFIRPKHTPTSVSTYTITPQQKSVIFFNSSELASLSSDTTISLSSKPHPDSALPSPSSL